MSVLVLGGAGYIGSHTALELIRTGENVVIADNLATGHIEAVPEGAKFYQGDLHDKSFLDSIFEKEQIDAVIHFAAYSLVGESVVNPLKYYDNNLCGTKILLDSMVEHHIDKIVFSSTAATYGEPENIPILETDRTQPTNPYGETKLAMEKMFYWTSKAHDFRYVSLRYFNACGADKSGKIGEAHNPESHLIPLILQVPNGKRESVSIYGTDYDTPDGTCIRDYIHVTDLAQAHILAVKYLRNGNESNIFNLGNGVGYSVREVIDTARKVTGHPIPAIKAPKRAGDPAKLVASSEKAKTILGWNPVHDSLEEIIADAWNWHKNIRMGFRNEVTYMVYRAINGLIRHAIESELITNDDVFVVRNQLMDILKLKDWVDAEPLTGTIEQLLEPVIDYAVQSGIIENTSVQRDLFDTRIMGVFTPMPREVNSVFQRKYAVSPISATEWYYTFSKNLNYVRAERIAKDLKWTYESEYGTLDITINRSKPEKDPRDIAAAKTQKTSNYPKCQLCAENMGFTGHLTHPARQNLRPVKLNINNQKWFMQYSPYGYYNEHCIVFNKEHIPMTINAQVFHKLFDFVEQFPHYFIGSNADLPIVGGSILTHEHFQGGSYDFAMAKAPIERTFLLKNYMNVNAGIVKWPMSVIRLSSDNRDSLADACADILSKWRTYTDETVGIFAKTEGIPHNTITPIARATSSGFECDLVLRNNITTKERPLGVFHPNPTLHHIKKENIGLIEVMGLAVLPARLADELAILKDAMLYGKDIATDDKIASHADWINEILANHAEFDNDNAMDIIRYEVGKVFEQVLEDAGVFKRDKQGKEAFARFVEQLS